MRQFLHRADSCFAVIDRVELVQIQQLGQLACIFVQWVRRLVPGITKYEKHTCLVISLAVVLSLLKIAMSAR